MFATPVGLKDLGADFDVHAPFSACRLCGALYQTDGDRTCKRYKELGILYELVVNGESKFVGPQYATALLDACTARRNRWREIHERRYHTQQEIETFSKTGYALTPEAAHRLAPYGITPLLTDVQDTPLADEITHALSTAPRKPHDDAEH